MIMVEEELTGTVKILVPVITVVVEEITEAVAAEEIIVAVVVEGITVVAEEITEIITEILKKDINP